MVDFRGDVVRVEIKDKQNPTGFLSHSLSPGSSVCSVVVKYRHYLGISILTLNSPFKAFELIVLIVSSVLLGEITLK